MAHEAELSAAIGAVRAAARVCRSVQKRLATAEALEKKDKSPVTVADFASQAIVCERLMRVLPDDAVVGEEGSEELRQDEQAALLDAVVREVSTETPASLAQVLDWIDRGGAAATTDRYWTLDPIDGTKGFLRGEQYAVAPFCGPAALGGPIPRTSSCRPPCHLCRRVCSAQRRDATARRTGHRSATLLADGLWFG